MSNNSSRCGADRYRYPVTISSTKQFRPPGLVSHFEPTTLSYLLKTNSCNLCKPPREIAAENNRILEALNINKFLQRVATNVLFVTASSATTLTPENEESSSHRCPQTWIFFFLGGGGEGGGIFKKRMLLEIKLEQLWYTFHVYFTQLQLSLDIFSGRNCITWKKKYCMQPLPHGRWSSDTALVRRPRGMFFCVIHT